MKWTFDDYRHYSTEHMQKAQKERIAKELAIDPAPKRKGILGKRRRTRHAE